jgi:hypothetical protein
MFRKSAFELSLEIEKILCRWTVHLEVLAADSAAAGWNLKLASTNGKQALDASSTLLLHSVTSNKSTGTVGWTTLCDCLCCT